MDFSKLRRDKSIVKSTLKEMDDGSITVIQPCKLYLPKRYEEHKLAIVETEMRVLAVFLLVVGDTCALSSAMAMMQIMPTSTTTVDVGGEDYYEFSFDKGAQLTPNRNLVFQDTLCYYVYDEFMAKGRSPAFMGYEDLAKIFETASYHAGFNVAANNTPIEMITAAICRDAKDKTVYYRHSEMRLECVNVALRNVSLGATNTTARLNGAYFDQGLRSALINPSKTAEPIETLLRM